MGSQGGGQPVDLGKSGGPAGPGRSGNRGAFGVVREVLGGVPGGPGEHQIRGG